MRYVVAVVVFATAAVVSHDAFSMDSCNAAIVIITTIILHNNNYNPHCVYDHLASYYCCLVVDAMNRLLLLCELLQYAHSNSFCGDTQIGSLGSSIRSPCA